MKTLRKNNEQGAMQQQQVEDVSLPEQPCLQTPNLQGRLVPCTAVLVCMAKCSLLSFWC